MAQDRYKYFRIEGRELADGLGKLALELEKGGPVDETVAHLLRLAHTLKGAARVVKQPEIADDAHAIEETLTPIRDAAAPPTRGHVDLVLARVDAINEKLARLGLPAPPPAEAARGGASAASESAKLPAEEPIRTFRADVEEMDAVLGGISEVSVHLASIRRSLGAFDEVARLAARLGEQVVKGPAIAIRVTTEELQSRAGALERELASGVEQAERELRQVKALAERLRLLPTGIVFDALERAVRDAAVALKKDVAFVGRGADVRLDADVLAEVQHALLHVVRNAVAHGIESEAVRAQAGKAKRGTVVVEVTRRGSRVSFACRDDGGGFDVAGIRAAAIERGLAVPDDTAGVLRLATSGGISTTSKVDAVSGRGVGLDVVRAVAERLGGELIVQSDGAKGSLVELVVGITLSSLEALVVEAGGEELALPLEAVRRTMRVASDDIVRSAEGEGVVVGGDVVPFVPLAHLLRLSRKLAAAAHDDRTTWSTVIVEHRGSLLALGVDRLRAAENVVLRPLPELAPFDDSVAGASLDEEGNPRIVLDVAGLFASATHGARVEPPARRMRDPILVIDDSLTTRMLEQSILESAGYDVEVATSAEDGLAKARLRRYALFLCDVEMPGMDGFGFVETTRSDPVLRETPVVLVTSRDAPEDRKRGEAAGASGYIVKGQFDQTDFLGRIRTLVGY